MDDQYVEDVPRLKLTVVGDGTVGKTCLLYAFKNGQFPSEEYTPTIFENTSVEMDVQEMKLQLNLWDTAGQEAYEQLRLLIYPKTDVFLVCYAVNSPNSFHNVSAKWLPELKNYCPASAIIIVATKTDTRCRAASAMDRTQGRRLCKRLKADGFQECSAKTGQGIADVFRTAVLAALQGQRATPTCAHCAVL